jgi:hypothetical protein
MKGSIPVPRAGLILRKPRKGVKIREAVERVEQKTESLAKEHV